MKLILMRGLPGSGKTTKAHELMKKYGNFVRINRDDLRLMLHNGKWTGKNEAITIAAQKALVRGLLNEGVNVIIDDTNLAKKHLDLWENIAKEKNAKLEVVRLDTPWDRCVELDSWREKQVGSSVIVAMALQYDLFPKVPLVICDIDGTLADISHRLHFVRRECADCGKDALDNANCPAGGTHDKRDWDSFFSRVHKDKPRWDVWRKVMNVMGNNTPVAKNKHLMLVSARPETYRKETERWLALNGIIYTALFMRRAGDTRPDTEIKQDIYDRLFKKYPVEVVFDDRPSVIRMWESNDLSVVDVGLGVEF